MAVRSDQVLGSVTTPTWLTSSSRCGGRTLSNAQTTRTQSQLSRVQEQGSVAVGLRHETEIRPQVGTRDAGGTEGSLSSATPQSRSQDPEKAKEMKWES